MLQIFLLNYKVVYSVKVTGVLFNKQTASSFLKLLNVIMSIKCCIFFTANFMKNVCM